MKTILVTGASRGIGKCVAETLARNGYSVVLSARKAEVLEKVKSELPIVADDQSHDVLPLDLSTFTSAEQFKYDRPIDGFVNSAGIAPYSLLVRQQESQIAAILQTNVTAPILLTKALTKDMIRRKVPGSFVYLSTVIASRGVPGMCAYGASKGAMESFVKSYAREMGPKGFRANCVSPGLADTDMGRAGNFEQSTSLNIFKEFVPPQAVADAVLFLLKTPSTTGSVLYVDNGANA